MGTMIDTALAGRDAGIRDDARALVEKTYSKRLAGKVAVVTGGSTGMGPRHSTAVRTRRYGSCVHHWPSQGGTGQSGG
jgi:hypothetical protein